MYNTRLVDVLYWLPHPDSAKTPESESEQAKPARRTLRSESSESGSGAASPMDCVALQCKGVPLALNKKDVLEKHFARFGQVRRVLCRPAKSLAIIHFQDHVSLGVGLGRVVNVV